ncbi:MAG TPA: hypothetical protein PKA55_18975 [Rhodoblastus sp.]|nr:hypothetical protein [Rhodoblastus sp.]
MATSALIGAVTFIFGLLAVFIVGNGGIDYAIVKKGDREKIVLIVTNGKTSPIDISVAVSNKIEGELASSENASLVVTNEPGRKGSVISISGLAAREDFYLEFSTNGIATPSTIKLIKGPELFDVRPASVTRGKVDWTPLIIQVCITMIIYFIFMTSIDRRHADIFKLYDERAASLEGRLNKAEARADAAKLFQQRVRIYYSHVLRYLNKENRFLEDIMRSFLLRGGVSKVDVRRLLNEIAKRSGSSALRSVDRGWKDPTEEDQGLDVILDIIIDEAKRARMEELSAGKQT